MKVTDDGVPVQVASIVKDSPFEKPGALAAFVLGSVHPGIIFI